MNEQNQDWQDLVTDVDGFWNEESSPRVTGKLVSITEMMLARRPTIVAVILLSKPCKGVIGSKDEKETIDLEPGQAIGVVVKHKLQDLYSMLQNQCDVDITAKDKITLDNGNTLWRYAIRYRGQRVLTAAPRSRNAGSPGSKDSEASAKEAMESV
jgi:hypothetical protein